MATKNVNKDSASPENGIVTKGKFNLNETHKDFKPSNDNDQSTGQEEEIDSKLQEAGYKDIDEVLKSKNEAEQKITDLSEKYKQSQDQINTLMHEIEKIKKQGQSEKETSEQLKNFEDAGNDPSKMAEFFKNVANDAIKNNPDINEAKETANSLKRMNLVNRLKANDPNNFDKVYPHFIEGLKELGTDIDSFTPDENTINYVYKNAVNAWKANAKDNVSRANEQSQKDKQAFSAIGQLHSGSQEVVDDLNNADELVDTPYGPMDKNSARFIRGSQKFTVQGS